MPALRRSIQRLAGLFAVIWLLGWPPHAAGAKPTPSWIPAAQAPGHISPVGGVGVRARGKDLVIRGYVPRFQKGVAGFRVLETIRADGATDLPRDRGAARAAPLRGLVLDLRKNGGGVTVAALALADQLIAKGTLMRVSGRPHHPVQQIDATGTGLHTTVPLAVLTDRDTASSAEILTRALQANGRARVFGDRTFGKGIGQLVMPLADGSHVHLTTTKHYDGAGNTWNKKGIKPDVDLRTILRAARGQSIEDPVLAHAIADFR